MNTWKEELPPELPRASLAGRLAGAVRLLVMVLMTLIAVVLFLIGRALRAVLGRWVTFHFGVARFWSWLCLWLTGLRLRVHGTPVGAGALVANHSSWIDILALRSVRLIYFVSKAEVANWPGVGFITRITGTVFIERKRSQAKAQEAILRERIAADQLLCFFPEGTSTDGLRVLPFKSSLFSAFFTDGQGTDLAIQPVTVRYHPAERGGLPYNVYGWWGSMGFEAHIWDILTHSFGGTVEVIFHPATSASSFVDRKRLAEHCQRLVAHGMETGLPAPESAGQESIEEAKDQHA